MSFEKDYVTARRLESERLLNEMTAGNSSDIKLSDLMKTKDLLMQAYNEGHARKTEELEHEENFSEQEKVLISSPPMYPIQSVDQWLSKYLETDTFRILKGKDKTLTVSMLMNDRTRDVIVFDESHES